MSVNNYLSSEQTIKCGVPQGSILGPWRYLIYSNDIYICVSCHLLIYANNTVLSVTDKKVNKVAECLSKDVSRCHHWLRNNHLSMHMGKTEALFFTSKRKNLASKVVIKCEAYEIRPSNVVKYLSDYRSTLDWGKNS